MWCKYRRYSRSLGDTLYIDSANYAGLGTLGGPNPTAKLNVVSSGTSVTFSNPIDDIQKELDALRAEFEAYKKEHDED
jgi:hypothetical protein